MRWSVVNATAAEFRVLELPTQHFAADSNNAGTASQRAKTCAENTTLPSGDIIWAFRCVPKETERHFENWLGGSGRCSAPRIYSSPSTEPGVRVTCSGDSAAFPRVYTTQCIVMSIYDANIYSEEAWTQKWFLHKTIPLCPLCVIYARNDSFTDKSFTMNEEFVYQVDERWRQNTTLSNSKEVALSNSLSLIPATKAFFSRKSKKKNVNKIETNI